MPHIDKIVPIEKPGVTEYLMDLAGTTETRTQEVRKIVRIPK